MSGSLSVCVVYHSGAGHTAQQAQAVAWGVSSAEGVGCTLIPVAEVEQHWGRLEAAHGIIFGCPTYMGSGSAAFKEFMEKSSALWAAQKWKDKLAAGFTNSACLNGDKLETLMQLSIFAAQHAMVWVPLGLLPGKTAEEPNRLGSFIGAMSQAEGKDAPSRADLQTAEHLGKAVSVAAKRWYR